MNANISEGETKKSLEKMQMQEGIVAFLDALGVKEIWARAEPNDILGSWEEVLGSFNDSMLRVQKAEDKIFGSHSDYHIAAFSDTVILAVKCEDPSSHIPLMADIICHPFSLALLKGIYFRGVISLGKFYGSKIDD